MGMLRLYLALCVVANHGGPVFPWLAHNGSQAVQIFYMISGFYMAMVLSTRYTRVRDFYRSRFLRIFRPYWIILLTILFISLCSGLLFHDWLELRAYASHPFKRNGVCGVVFATLSNFTLFGQDWIMFLKQDRGEPLQFTANFWADRTPLWHYFLLQQTWTLGVELTFYACAPFLNRLRTSWLVCVAVAAFVARLAGYQYFGLAHDPWTYRFFPFELSLFLFGMLGYRLYARVVKNDMARRCQINSRTVYFFGVVSLLFLMCADVHAVEILGRFIGAPFADAVTNPLFMLFIPFLFLAFGKNPLDRFIGELSFPIYLLYDFVIVVVSRVPELDVGENMGRMDALLTVLLAWGFYRFIIAPPDRKRHSDRIENPEGRETFANPTV